MGVDAKSRRCELAHVLEAAAHVEDARAAFAGKVMVVPLSRAFVSRRFSRNLDGFQPAFFEESGDCAVGRRDADAGGGIHKFVDRQRAIATLKNIADRFSLASLTGRCAHLFIFPRGDGAFTADQSPLDYLQMIS